jgi:hypothetical protein
VTWDDVRAKARDLLEAAYLNMTTEHPDSLAGADATEVLFNQAQFCTKALMQEGIGPSDGDAKSVVERCCHFTAGMGTEMQSLFERLPEPARTLLTNTVVRAVNGSLVDDALAEAEPATATVQ